MCNLYSMTSNREAIRRLFAVALDLTDNQPPLPAIFPDQLAPVIRHGADGQRRMEAMRWGFPCPPNVLSRGVTTNVRNTSSPYWRTWLRAESRCLVPVTAFAEYADVGGRKVPTWFALDEEFHLASDGHGGTDITVPGLPPNDALPDFATSKVVTSSLVSYDRLATGGGSHVWAPAMEVPLIHFGR